MQEASADPRVSEPTPEGLNRSHLNIGVLEEFAQNMTENIIQSFTSQMEMVAPEVDCQASRFDQNQETFAEELALAVMDAALREVCGGHNVENHDGSKSTKSAFINESDSERSTDMDPGKEIQMSKETQPFYPTLSQSGLLIMGSLDYPDAPPTTPLLPQLERSRHSFARKLKGGLAKVFLPSPPPPTPKDKEEDRDRAANDSQVELMEHLMHSLSTDDLAKDSFEVGPHHGAKLEAFAEALSCDIIGWVLSDKNREQIADSDLHLLAHQLAETIISSFLDEAKMLV
ncbi:uncharacterized protein si:dkey-171c9.3 [Etheostoma cragini]|uniref:uncharacterized protein si:dkey-171c9.3 n=1 Tax=Etheostoma cragini TaxID=417921 RepID=UPI00155E3251|nr:uncharacterized protein si:dkey-171c9.3 [Etheostoma cragini]XP_034713104.1 uncharacterized protein si:dkey-171c9.3 [Etheostoma cragini]XP_034713105.1 uncharacterized protein si:dkey-171c9.3 [Etheostoma cragini]